MYVRDNLVFQNTQVHWREFALISAYVPMYNLNTPLSSPYEIFITNSMIDFKIVFEFCLYRTRNGVAKQSTCALALVVFHGIEGNEKFYQRRLKQEFIKSR